VSVRPAEAYDKVVAPHIESYYGERFEKFCHEAISEIYLREGVSATHEVGEYWDKEVQVDVVSLRDDAMIDVGECKWGVIRSWPAAVKEAKEKDGVRCVGVDELYG